MEQLELFPSSASRCEDAASRCEDTNTSARVEVLADKGADEGSEALVEYINEKQISFREAMERYDPVQAHYDPVHGSFIVMAERDPGLAVTTALDEFGRSSPSPWTSWTRTEHNPKLRDKQGLTQYYRMKRADGIVRGALRTLKTPIQAARWYVEPASDSTRDVNVANFVEDNFFNRLHNSWARLLDDILLMCEYGFMVFEKVYTISDDGKIRLKKLAPRHPLDVREWKYDDNGGPDGLILESNDFEGRPQGVFIPIEKLVIFTLEAEAGDLSGISILRSAYKHYFYKDTMYKIDAIQKERHGIGVPIIKLPASFTTQDKKLADDLGRNLRTNERAHIVLPPGWEVLFAKLEGQPVDCLKSIDHHNMQIMANILAPFMETPKVDQKSMDMFLKSTRYIANIITDTFNRHVIPQLVDFNSTRVKYPKLRARRIGEWEDIRTFSFALRNMVGAKVVTPDDELEKFVRKELDLPLMDPDTQRGAAGPQVVPPQAPEAGLPRQQPTPPVGVPAPVAGQDRSGG